MILGYIDPGSGITFLSLGAGMIAFFAGGLAIFLLFIKKFSRFFKKNRRIILITIAVILFVFVVTIVIMNNNKSTFNKKVIIIGFDGLSPEMLEPMMQEGQLPNFARLKQQGSYRRLSTTNPPQSPVAWAGFATGKKPGKTGIFDFIIRDPKIYAIRLSLSNIQQGGPKPVIRERRFWHYTSDKKIPTTIIGCPLTFPPEKIYGKMLSGMGVTDILGTEGTFTFYTTQELAKDKDIGGKVFHVDKSSVMNLNLIGPRVSVPGGETKNLNVPFRVILQPKNNHITIEYQGIKFDLSVGEWSDWKEVTFKLGFFRKSKGIFKFYLIEINPGFKLYVSPINFDPRDPFFDISYPSSYSRELAENIGLYYTRGMPMDTWALNEERISEEVFLEQVNDVLRQKTAMLNFELNRFKKGVLFCYFESVDIIQHMFWRYTDSEHPLYDQNTAGDYAKIIRQWYKKMDNVLGIIMQRLNDEDTLIVLSDHGFGTFRRSAHVNKWLRDNGYLKLRNPDASFGAELLNDIDWSKTYAYAMGFGAIYINQKGRELDGIVMPGADTEFLKNEIIEKLKKWQDDKYNKFVISNVYKAEDIFSGPYMENAPDLYIGFNLGYRASWQTVLGGVPAKPLEDNLKKWSGSHLFDPQLIPGVLFLNKKEIKQNPSIYDITPTVLKAVGYSQEEIKELNMDGAILY